MSGNFSQIYTFGVNGTVEGAISFVSGQVNDPNFNIPEMVTALAETVSDICQGFFISAQNTWNSTGINTTSSILHCDIPTFSSGRELSPINDTWALSLRETASNCSQYFAAGFSDFYAFTCQELKKQSEKTDLNIATPIIFGTLIGLAFVIYGGIKISEYCNKKHLKSRCAQCFNGPSTASAPLINPAQKKYTHPPMGYYGSSYIGSYAGYHP